MTTDPFTEAARAEAERYFADPGVDPLALSVIDHAMHMAEWARTHLAAQETDGGHGPRTTAAIREWTGAWPAAQEPTDAELDAAHAAFTAHSRTRLSEDREADETVCDECGYATTWPLGYRTEKRATRHAAREAILAARAARRDEETR